jgi:DNA-binding response OmpR family regulator
VRAILRRARPSSLPTDDQLLGPQGIVMRLRSHSVTVANEDVPLTPKEFAVLRLLLERRGEVINPDELSVKIWGYETFGSRNFVEAHVSRLRSKLTRAGAGDVITTMRGVGYMVR